MHPLAPKLLVLCSTYGILALLFSVYRRPLEQLLSELTTGMFCETEASVRRAFAIRTAALMERTNGMQRCIVYCFPESAHTILRCWRAARFLLWPLAALRSVLFYYQFHRKPESPIGVPQ